LSFRISDLIRKSVRLALKVGFSFQLLSIAVLAQEEQFASLGDFKLGSGEVIRDCRVGYRTFGKLNRDKSNAVVFPTWASGTTEQLKSNIGPGKLIDSEKYFVIAIDALGNGVSSSPSNSRLQPRMSFPKFTLRDIVETQHELVTKILHLNHVRAVAGVSMGGMQTFQWMVAYPEFMDKAIPIVGSPRLASYDLLLWQAQIDAIMNDSGWNNGNYTTNPSRVLQFEFGELLLTTPDNYNRQVTREQLFDRLRNEESNPGFDANDKIRQAQAMMALDVSKSFNGSMERAAGAVKASVFVIVARMDHVVTPGPALEFARLLDARTLVLEGDCGHLAPSCEWQKVNPAVAEFLDR
jgi:homoserine O-acetyltransferase